MKFTETKISDLIIIEPTVFGDSRGYFLESYNKKKFKEIIEGDNKNPSEVATNKILEYLKN